MYSTRQEVIEKLLNGDRKVINNDSSEMDTHHGSTDDSSTSASSVSSSEIDSSRDLDSNLAPKIVSTNPAMQARQRQWTDSEQFVEDNLKEVYEKLPNMEKQIWGKLIVMEGNRRTAKAYLRHPLITIDGSDVEFDGLRIGLSRFENPTRSSIMCEILNDIVAGIKIKIDPDGNVWAKRSCFSPVFLKPLYRNRMNDLFLIDQRPVKVFDIRRFKEVLVHELKQAAPDRRKLEKCCMVCLKFSMDHSDLLKTPVWILIVHLVAIELLNLVLPKDNDMSSPSSSFTTSPAPIADFGHSKMTSTSGDRQKAELTNSSKRLYAKHHRDSGRERKGQHWQAPPHPSQMLTTPQKFFTSLSSSGGRGCASLTDLRFPHPHHHHSHHDDLDEHCDHHPSFVITGAPQWSIPPPHQQAPPPPLIPRRPQMGIAVAGQRVFSMEALNHPTAAGFINRPMHFLNHARPPFVPQQLPHHLHHHQDSRILGAKFERMQLQKWRSQDSGIASGSGSYGRK